MSSFSTNLKNLRVKRGIKQTDIAEFLGVQPRAIRFYESGEREPNIENIIKLCKFFNVTSDFLLGLDEPKPLSDSS